MVRFNFFDIGTLAHEHFRRGLTRTTGSWPAVSQETYNRPEVVSSIKNPHQKPAKKGGLLVLSDSGFKLIFDFPRREVNPSGAANF